MTQVEERTGKGFGDPKNPLLVSVRSGAKFSMPGMMDTVLNLGLNEETLQGLIALTGNERFGWDAYRRFIQMFGRIVMDVRARVTNPDGSTAEYNRSTTRSTPPSTRAARSDTDLDAAALQDVVAEYKAIVRAETGREFPTDAYEQLDLAIKAVFASWFGKRAIDYRNSQKIAHDLGTAVNVVTMVFGNMGDDSGTGVAFTRDPNTGEKVLYGEYLTNAQGEDVVAGIRTAPEDRADGHRDARGLRGVRAHRPAARAALPGRPGPRVHHRARQALHAPDPRREADRRRGREDRGRHGGRGPHHRGRGGRADRAGPGGPAPARPVRSEGPQGRRARRQGPERLPRRGRRAGRVQRRRRGRVGRHGARRSSWCASRPRRTTSTAWPSPRAS